MTKDIRGESMTKEITTAGPSGGDARPPRLRLLWGLAAAVLLALTVAACGGSGSSGSSNASAPVSTPAGGAADATAACTPSGTSLQISAKNLAFDKNCLAAPANTPFTITFKNDDPGLPHNVAIYTNSSATTKLFAGDTVTGPATVTYQVPALKPGTYFFRCDIHPTQMTGTFIVK
ncbi:MAG: cupredoxin domain-containing protein [Pseudonocardiaceae bacterium]